jgi:hypothetical protein
MIANINSTAARESVQLYDDLHAWPQLQGLAHWSVLRRSKSACLQNALFEFMSAS